MNAALKKSTHSNAQDTPHAEPSTLNRACAVVRVHRHPFKNQEVEGREGLGAQSSQGLRPRKSGGENNSLNGKHLRI